MYFNEEHKKKVIERGDGYIYIGSYKSREITIDEKNKKKNKTYIRIKCPYCGKEYDMEYWHFINRKDKCTNCCNEYKNSFAYYIQQELKEPLNKYWDWKNNIVNPYLISKHSNKKIWLKCSETNYHKDYNVIANTFVRGDRCPYCSTRRGKVHPKDSFGTLYPEKAKYWSKNNKKSPFEVTFRSDKKYKFICENCGKEFERTLSNLNRNDTGVVCASCQSSKLEQKTKKVLDKYNIEYKTQVTYEGLIGLKGGNLSYDFHLPKYNLLIECQGEQHEKFIKGLHKTYEKFEKQLEHDRRKKEYAKEHNINLLEIWYYDIDNIEEILLETLQIKNN